MSAYDIKPKRFLTKLHEDVNQNIAGRIYCAGFELGVWRNDRFAYHLAEWLPDYALPEEELRVDHGNVLEKLNQAAVRVYTSPKYESRGEVGEIALHAICRDFFSTVPLSSRVFYKSSSNDVVKAFDMVHAHFKRDGAIQIWLGESKLYKSSQAAIGDAIKSVMAHIEAGFLINQKALLGPQIPKTTPRYDEIAKIFSSQESLDTLLKSAVFVIGIFSDSKAVKESNEHTKAYIEGCMGEIDMIRARLEKSGLKADIKFLLVYVPLLSKKSLVQEFDRRLKGFQ